MPHGVLVVFAKRPVPGAVKTRMCPPLRLDQAAALYAAMLEDVLATTAAAAATAQADLWLQVFPADAAAEMSLRCPPGFSVRAQHGRDLGERMAHAVTSAAAAGYRRILLRGSDSPALPREELVEGLAALAHADLAVGPDLDGGYTWIALRRPVPGLFDHPMSTSRVLEDTLARAAAHGLAICRCEPRFDLDTAGDLRRLADLRRRGGALECRRTLAFLDERALWPTGSEGEPIACSEGKVLPGS